MLEINEAKQRISSYLVKYSADKAARRSARVLQREEEDPIATEVSVAMLKEFTHLNIGSVINDVDRRMLFRFMQGIDLIPETINQLRDRISESTARGFGAVDGAVFGSHSRKMNVRIDQGTIPSTLHIGFRGVFSEEAYLLTQTVPDPDSGPGDRYRLKLDIVDVYGNSHPIINLSTHRKVTQLIGVFTSGYQPELKYRRKFGTVFKRFIR